MTILRILRAISFHFFALAAILAGGFAAAVAVAAFSTQVQVPRLSEFFAQSEDSVLELWAVASAGGAGLAWLLAWILSLSPHRRRRPYVRLFLMGLGPGAMAGAAAWLFGNGQPGMAGDPALAAAGAALLLTPLALILAEFLLAKAVQKLAEGSWAAGLLKSARFWTNRWRNLDPGNPKLNRRLGLIDFRLHRTESALPRLRAEFEANPGDLETAEALWQIAAAANDEELLEAVGPAILEREGASSLSPGKIRRRLAEIAVRGERVAEAIALLEKAIDRENPVDLEAVGRLYLHEKRWSDLEEILSGLLRAEAPPRPRRSGLLNLAIRERDPGVLPLVRREAENLRQANRLDEEAELLELVLKLDQDNPSARARLIEIYRSRDRAERLIVLLRASQERGGDESAATALELADLLAGSRRYDEAEEMAFSFGSRYPDDHRFPLAMARVRLALGDLDKAAESMSEAEALAQAKGEALPEEQAAKLKPLRRKIEAALDKRDLDDIERRARENPDDAELRLDFVERLARRGRLERAAVEADALLERLPQERERAKAKLLELASQGENYLIAEYLAKLMIADGELDGARDLFARMAKSSFEPEQTLREGALLILKADPGHRDSHFQLFELAVKKGDWNEAAKRANCYMDLKGELDFEQRSALFDAYCKLRDLERGAPLGRQLIDEQPYGMERVLKLAELYIFHDLFPEAHALLARAKEIEPGNNRIYALLEEAKNRQREKRSLEIRHLLDKDPENPELLRELGEIMVSFKRYEDALRHYQRAAHGARDEDQRQVCQTWLAWCMVKRHMLDTAMETLRDAPLNLSESRKALGERKRLFYEIAEALEQNNQHDESLELYKQVFKVDAGFRHVMQKMEQLSR